MDTAPLSPPVPEATCPEHLGQTPSGTCRRCGRFVCATCAVQAGLCAECQQRKLGEVPSAARRAAWARFFLGTRVASAVLVMGGNLWRFSALGDDQPPSEALKAFLSIARAMNPLIVLSALGVIFCFLRWLHLAVRTTNVLGLSDEDPRWSVFCWFIPLANVIKPYHVVSDLWANVVGGGPRRTLLQAWWVTWLTANAVRYFSQWSFQDIGQAPSQASSALLSGAVSESLFLVSALLCMRVIADIQRPLEALRSGGQAER